MGFCKRLCTGDVSFFRAPSPAVLAWSLALFLALPGCGGGGGGGGGGDDGAIAERVVVSGTVRNLSSAGEARVARSELSGVSDCAVSVSVDLDGDGAFDPGTEVFATRAQDGGGFSLSLPSDAAGKLAELRIEKPGYSKFIRRYEALETSVLLDPVLSEGAVSAVDLGGISATPARAGRKTIDADQVVTVSLVRNPATGRRSARTVLGEAPAAPDGEREELARMSFSLRGLNLPADTGRLYASVAYLDTVNDPDAMPGGFRASGDGDSAVDMLSTYAASEMSLTDELGNPLMTDPNDRSREIQIRIAIPEEALDGLVDEDPGTDAFEIPLFYYDEPAGIWRMHRTADGEPAYGVLEDAYGNRVAADEVAQMASGQSAWTPLYGVGTVHHFTTWNCDRAWRSSSFNFDLSSPGGDDDGIDNVSVRIRSRSGPDVTDYSNRGRRDRKGRRNLHAYRSKTFDSIIRRLLDRTLTKEERASLLYGVMNAKNPDVMTGLVEALRRYEEQQRDDIAGETDELKRGIMAIFRNKEITDAFINTEGLDCSKVPDLCKGAIAAAAETVNRSTDAKKAVAFLMQIAVETYDPRNLNFEYAAGKGIEFLDIAVNTGGAASELQDIAGKVGTAKALGSQALEAYRAYKRGAGSWSAYWDLASQFRDAMEDIKSAATTAGGRLGRAARVRRPAPLTMPTPATSEEEAAAVEDVAREVLYTYDEVSGALFGASRMLRYQWGYFDPDGTFHELEDWAGKPALVGGGGAMMLEYYDGTDWVPLEGRSDLGVDASYIPLPAIASFGAGSAQAPVLNLGTFTLDIQPNLEVTGRVLSENGDPLPNVKVVIAGQEFSTGPDGRITGQITWYSESRSVPYQIPNFQFYRYATAGDGVVDLGEIPVSDRIIVQYGSAPWRTAVRRGETQEVTPLDWLATLSGREPSFSYALYKGWPNDESVPVDEATGPSYVFSAGASTEIGYYTLRVTARVEGDDSVQPYTATLTIQVQNSPPEITAFTATPDAVKAGTPVAVAVSATDPDGDDDIRQRYVYAACESDDGRWYGLGLAPEEDGSWALNTEPAIRLLEGTIQCMLTGTVLDSGGQADRATTTVVIRPNPLPPEPQWGGLKDEYVVSKDSGFWPARHVYFTDPNGDLDHFELDCGDGSEPASASTAWGVGSCAYAEPGDYALKFRAVDAAGLETELQATVHVLAPLRFEVAVGGESVPTDGAVVELPPDGGDPVQVTVAVVSDNGPEGYVEGGGTIASGTYSVVYRSGTMWWWGEYLSVEEELPAGGAIPLAVDRPGSYTVSVVAQDERGMSARFSQVIEVTAPFDGELYVDGAAADRFLAGGGWLLSGDEVVFSVEDLSAPEGAEMRYRWFVDGAGQGEFTATEFRHTFGDAGEHTVRVEIQNNQETTAHTVAREVSFQVYDPVPVALDAGAGDGLRAGDLFQVSAAVPDGVTVTRVRWSVTGGPADGFRPVPAEDPLAAAWTFVLPGSYTVEVTVEDDRGMTATESYGPVVVTADPPEITAFDADPSSGRPPVTVAFTVDAIDPDARDGEVLRYRWFVDGEPVDAGTDAAFSHEFTAEGSHTVRVEVTDAGGLADMASVTVDVRDRPPVVSSLTVQPGSGVAPLSVTATASATDDGEVEAYAWFLDGEAVGTGATLAHTFDTPGTYTLRVEVTDDAGQTTAGEATVYVLDPDATGIVVAFNELRADGLGEPVDFADLADYLSHGGGMSFARSPLDDLSGDAMTIVDLAPQLAFTGPAFYGYHGERWGDVFDTMVMLTSSGTYDVAVEVYETDALAHTAAFGQAYECGALVYGDWAQSFGTWSTADPVDTTALYPSSSALSTDDTLHLIALLGDRDPEDVTTCVYTYAGFARSASATISLGSAEEVGLKPVEVVPPSGMSAELSDVAVVVDGVALRFGSVTQLPTDAEGRHEIPVVPGADYRFSFRMTTADLTWTAVVPVEGTAVAGDDPVVVVSLDGVSDTGTLELSNAPQGTIYLEVAGASGTFVEGSRGISENRPGLDGLLGLADADRVRVLFDGDTTANGPGFYRSWAAAEFPNPLDLAAPGLPVSVDGPSIAVDTDAQTVTVSYAATGADACFVAFSAGLDADGDGWADRYRSGNYLTGGSITSVVVPYPVDASVVGSEWGDPMEYPAASELLDVSAQVTCLSLGGGYDAFVRDLLGQGGSLEDVGYGWSVEELADIPSVEAMVWRRASWSPEQP